MNIVQPVDPLPSSRNTIVKSSFHVHSCSVMVCAENHSKRKCIVEWLNDEPFLV